MIIKETGEEVVVKCHSSRSPNNLRRFIKEAEIMKKAFDTGCLNFLRVYGYFSDKDSDNLHRFTLVMESCKESLDKEIDYREHSKKKYSEEELFTFTTEMISAFRLLVNELNVIHRDIKPQNIFMKENSSNYKIGDFDISLDAASHGRSTYLDNVVGTKPYMAPEMYEAYRGINIASSREEKERILAEIRNTIRIRKSVTDVFSLGLTILEMATLSRITEYNQKSQEEINIIIDNIQGYDNLKPILRDMLVVDFRKRKSFEDLNETYVLSLGRTHAST